MKRISGLSIFLIIIVQLQLVLHADQLPLKSIDEQLSDQQSCVDKKLPICEEKCQAVENASVHCHALCKLNITNQCRYAGE